MRNNQVRKLIFTALCITLGLILPQFNRFIPIPNAGAVLLPMHIPVLLAGFLCGLPYAALCGLILPLLSFAITGMPPIYPIGLSMMLELAAYGAITAILYKLTKGKVFVSLIGGMLGGRIVMGIANAILLGMAGNTYGVKAFVTAAFVTALPGIIIQIIIIPIIVVALRKAKLVDTIA